MCQEGPIECRTSPSYLSPSYSPFSMGVTDNPCVRQIGTNFSLGAALGASVGEQSCRALWQPAGRRMAPSLLNLLLAVLCRSLVWHL